MGSGCANNELTYLAKKPRERRRREKVQRKRLAALGVPTEKVAKLNIKQVRNLLRRPTRLPKTMLAAGVS